ncbi:hypothetical protein AD936_05545 [Gluconobacter japonicus]|nr:hypothetical protein AD936_05545 [Gluconobacter japonicus]
MATEYDFDAVGLFVFSLVIFDRLSAGFSSRDARPDPFFFQGIPEPVSIITRSVSIYCAMERLIQQGRGSGVITDL